VSLYELNAVLCAKLPEDSTNALSKLAEKHTLSVLRHEHDVISTIPADVRLALPFSHDDLLSFEPGSSVKGDRLPLHDGTAEPFRVTPPEAAAYQWSYLSYYRHLEIRLY
jgi:hypothetical protein